DGTEDQLENSAAASGKKVYVGDSQRTPLSLLTQLAGVDTSAARIKITYDAAPLGSSTGAIRLWTSATSTDPAAYLAPGEYDVGDLGIPSGLSDLALYIEGVSTTAAPSPITIEIDPDGSGAQGFILTDRVHVTVESPTELPAAIRG